MRRYQWEPGLVKEPFKHPRSSGRRGPLELVLAFPAPADPQWARSLIGRSISYFDPARRTAEKRSAAVPLGTLHIAGLKLADQGRTLILATDPHPRAARYTIDLGSMHQPGKLQSYDLFGVEAAWSAAKDDAGAEPVWKGWWPDIDIEVTRRLTRASAPHERLAALIQQPGRLTLSTLVSLPAGETTLRIDASGAITDATLGDEQPVADPQPAQDGTHSILIPAHAQDLPLFLTFSVETGKTGQPLMIHAFYNRGKSERFQTIERQQFTVPWAPAPPVSPAPTELSVPDLAGGDRKRGETLFFSDQCDAPNATRFVAKVETWART